MNTGSKIKNFSKTLREDRIRSEIHHQKEIDGQKQKISCPTCRKKRNLICYGCCYSLGCQNCYDSQHFRSCSKVFNQHAINFKDKTLEEQNKFKRNGKSSKIQQKCQRCLQIQQIFKYCQECKIRVCNKCSDELHLTSKFMKHVRIQNPIESLRQSNISVSNIEMNSKIMQKSIKVNYEGKDQSKRQKLIKHNNIVQAKRGNSMAKEVNINQQNIQLRPVKRHMHMASIEDEIISPFPSSPTNKTINIKSWDICQQHNIKRNIITNMFELICQKCYQNAINTRNIIRVIDIQNIDKTEISKEMRKLNIESTLSEYILKMQELKIQFLGYKQILAKQLTKQQQMLIEKYNQNLLNVQKWEKQYKQSIHQIIIKCKEHSDSLFYCSQLEMIGLQKDYKAELIKISNMKSLLLFQEVNHRSKAYSSLFSQFQFSIKEFQYDQFQQLLKKFSFLRRKIENESQMSNGPKQKSLGKMSQRNQLAHSRVSSNGFKTDRKMGNKDENNIRSSYYQISAKVSNASKGTSSKDIKNTEKADSEKNLPIKGIYNDKKLRDYQAQLKNSQYFLAGPQQKIKGKKQSIEFGLNCLNSMSTADFERLIYGNIQKECLNQNIILDKKQGGSQLLKQSKCSAGNNSLQTTQRIKKKLDSIEIREKLYKHQQPYKIAK